MTNLTSSFTQLNENLQILREREAKYGGTAPVELINQIADHEQAIALTGQAITGELSGADWREALRPLLVEIDRRSQAEAACRVEVDAVAGDIIGSIFAANRLTPGDPWRGFPHSRQPG